MRLEEASVQRMRSFDFIRTVTGSLSEGVAVRSDTSDLHVEKGLVRQKRKEEGQVLGGAIVVFQRRSDSSLDKEGIKVKVQEVVRFGKF